MARRFIPLEFREYPPEEMARRAEEFCREMQRRRTVRTFSDRPVPRAILEWAIRTAASAPSGANKQPWQFVVVGHPDVKERLREAAEAEERKTYEERMPESWRAALDPLGTDWHKPFLTTCPWLIVVFAQSFTRKDGEPAEKHYYVQESVGIATGMLLAALHHAGLATLTHTPSPMGFLRAILGRPLNERPFVLIGVGYPAEGCRVPDLKRKSLEAILTLV